MNQPIDLPLPEEAVPTYAERCEKCELHTQRRRIIWGEGYWGAPLMLLLDNPGAREDATGVPFVCGTRQTLLALAFQAGINREQLYITYVVKCRPLRSYDKNKARSTHPLAVRRRPNLFRYALSDWQMVAAALKNRAIPEHVYEREKS